MYQIISEVWELRNTELGSPSLSCLVRLWKVTLGGCHLIRKQQGQGTCLQGSVWHTGVAVGGRPLPIC